MRAPTEVRVELQRLEFSGQARGRHENKLVFAWGGLPQETVTARVARRQRNSLSCVVTEVHAASPDRVPPCETHYLSCSPWQILAEDREASYKAELVRELFARQFQLELPPFEIPATLCYGYRNKLEFSFTECSEGLSLAFFERESHRRKLPLDGCRLGSDAINAAARHVCEVLRASGVRSEQLKSLVVRSNQRGDVAAALYVTESVPPICEAINQLRCLVGMRVFASDPRSPAAVASQLLEEQGTAVLQETVLGRTFRYSDRSFFQVNVPVYERALSDLSRFVETQAVVYDLYAGVGTIGLCAGGARTVFVESDPESIDFLRQNCQLNGVNPSEVLSAPVEKALAEVPPEATVIVDPPRAGLHPRLLKRLVSGLPQRIVYLSCNPQTQGQDLTALKPHYELIHFAAYNFFPRTPRVETLAVLDRRP